MSGPRNHSTTAGARFLLLVLIAMLGVVGIALFSGGDDSPAEISQEPAAEPRGRTSTIADRPEATRLVGAEATREPSRAEPLGDDLSQPLDEPDGQPIGVLRGELVFIGAGAERLETWTLNLEPSRSLRGREAARSMQREFAGTERSFRLDSVPLAGYDVFASAPGFQGRRIPVLLTEAAPHALVNLDLRLSGIVSGRVVDDQQQPLDSLGVQLVARPGSERLETLTDQFGGFELEPVRDGTWTLTLGNQLAPVVEPINIDVAAPGMQLGDVVVPRLGSLDIIVRSPGGAPIEGARVRGTGMNGGLVDVTTDHNGRGVAHFLPPGLYRLRTAVDGEGRGFGTVQIDPNAPRAELELELVP